MVIGCVSEFSAFAWVSGRSIGTPTVIIGAATMKMISSTSMTSTSGVTLISVMTRLAATAATASAAPAAIASTG